MIINIFIISIFLLSIIFTFKYKFIQLKFFSNSKKALRNKTSYTAFLLSLGSHIGAGNILGVTTALILGGPGVLFWMVVCTIFTTIFSLIENTLGLKYQVIIESERRGGSPYYILYGLNKKRVSKIFSILLVLSSTIFFLPIQVKGVSFSLNNLFNINQYLIISILLLFSFVFIFRGTNILTNIINKIVPFMTLLFLLVCIYGLIIRFNFIDDVLILIVKDAFTVKSGFLSMVILGLKRSLFSNEAGLGTAPSINCYSDNKPIRQGYLQVLTCFIDTIVMCILLGVVILLFNINLDDFNSEQLSITIFENILPNYGDVVGNIILFTFSLATIISGYYAGESNMLFNCINKNNKVEKYKFIYRLLFIIGLFIGVFFENNKIWDLVDYGLVLLGSVNIIVIIKLQPKFKEEIINKLS